MDFWTSYFQFKLATPDQSQGSSHRDSLELGDEERVNKEVARSQLISVVLVVIPISQPLSLVEISNFPSELFV